MHYRTGTLIFLLLFAGLTNTASGQDIIFKPINPSFGGNSFNSSHLLATAEAQKMKEEKQSASRASQSNSDRFIRLLESRLYSSLATAVSEAIFGDSAKPNGTIRFDDQEVTFVNSGGEIKLTINDFSTGQVTNITVPTLVTP